MATHIGYPQMRGWFWRRGRVFYVVARGRGVMKRQLMSILFVNYRQLSPFVDWKNVQRTLAIQNERLVFGRQGRGFLADGTARAKPIAGVYFHLETNGGSLSPSRVPE
jgi:hypothetical protein